MDRSKWEYKKLGEVCTVVSGSTPKTQVEEFWNGSHYWITPAELDGSTYVSKSERLITDAAIEKTNLSLLPVGTVLLSSRAPIGKVAITTVPMYCNQGFKNLICSDTIYNKYLYWFLKVNTEYLNSLGRGATFKEISKTIVENIKIPLYSLADQQRIVAELDCLNEMIALKQEQLKEFDKLAQSIFYDMFGKGCSQQQWEYTTIGNISEEVKYGTSSPATPNGRYKYLRMNNMTNDGYLDLSDLKYIDIAANDYEKYVVRKGDVLFNRTNSRELVGKTALFNYDEEMIIAGYIIRVRLKTTADPCFVVRYMNLPEQKDYLRGLCRGAIGQANINAKELQAIPIPLPPLALQQQFAEKIQAIEAQKELVKKSIAETQQLLDSRMDYYFD